MGSRWFSHSESCRDLDDDFRCDRCGICRVGFSPRRTDPDRRRRPPTRIGPICDIRRGRVLPTVSDRYIGPETSHMRKIRQAAIAFGPHAGAHRVALRAATSLAVPLIVLYLFGRMDLSIYASFGSLASLYGRFHYYGDRLRMQLGAGLVFISVMLFGKLLAILNARSEEHTSELQSRGHLVCRLLLEKKKNK